jgi:tRNA wybutosine-synthesizing protein 1
MCYKHQFYGIESHRCVQMTPTLRCNQRCLFCWRSFEHEPPESEECLPETILAGIHKYQKKALAGYNAVLENTVTGEQWQEALDPKHIAISLSGEPTLYTKLPELIDLFNSKGYTTFLVSNGTNPEVLKKCHPYQMYVSLDAPDRDTYHDICRPLGDYWDRIQESLRFLHSRRSAVRVTLVKGLNDLSPEKYAAILQDSGAKFVEIKGYMYLGYSRNRLARTNMPEHAEVRSFARKIAAACDYRFKDENNLSRVVLLERGE